MLSLFGFSLAMAACGERAEIATYRVEPKEFVHRVTAEGTLVATESTPVTLPPGVRGRFRLAWRLPDGAEVRAGDVLARFDPNELRQRLAEGEADLETRELEIQKSQLDRASQLSKISSDREVAELELSMKQEFQKTDTELYSRHEIIESELDEVLARERSEHARAIIGIQSSVSDAELELLRIEYRKAEREVEQATSALASLELRAPHSGVVTWKENWAGEIPQVGAMIWPGMPLAELPSLAETEAEVFVLEADAGGLAVGKPAEIVLEARPGTSYPGAIRRVSSVAETPFRGSPVQYFGVAVQFKEPPEEMPKPGQRVRATLLLDRQEEALVVPRQAIFNGDGGTKVYVAEGSGFVARSVRLGGASLGLVVVEEGLEAGERIAMEPPPELVDEEAGEGEGKAGALGGLLGIVRHR